MRRSSGKGLRRIPEWADYGEGVVERRGNNLDCPVGSSNGRWSLKMDCLLSLGGERIDKTVRVCLDVK